MAKLEDLREWLLDRIDGGEEMRGEDGLVSDFIRQIDAATAELADLKQRLLPQYIGRAERAQRERQMISHERDSLLEKLRAATSMPCAPSATAAPVAWCVGYDDPRMGRIHSDPTMHKPQAEALAERNGLALVSLYAGSLPVEEKAIGHARYEYVRTLNPRRFAALYNESLMGVHQLDDLVDRYRMKGEPGECGYDRTASLNAGHYVCTCGACSHYTTKEQP